MNATDQWIVIPNWEQFQHYKDRDPIFIKGYVRQLRKPEWTAQSLAARGLLETARLEFADRNGLLPLEDLSNTLRRGDRSHVARIVVSLNHAGLLDVVASRPLALALKPSNPRTRENKQDGRPACPFCEMGGGRHTSDCPALEHPGLMVEHLVKRL